jgi:hypothetical protein
VLSLGLAPVLATQLESGIAGATTTSDTVNYVQTTKSSSFSFVPGNGSASTTQTITPTGTCKTPSATSPLLTLSALVYKNLVSGAPYTGTPSTGTVGTSLGHTGVCDLSPAYAINLNEALTFAPGPNSLTSTRIFGEAKIPLALTSTIDTGFDSTLQSNTAVQGGGDDSTQSATVSLIAQNGSTIVGIQTLTIKGDGDGDADDVVTADTGAIPGGFTSLTLEVPKISSSKFGVSVVGTTSFSFLQIPQAIAFTNTPPTAPIVGGTYTVTATGGGSGNPVTFTVDSSSTSGCQVNLTTGVVLLNGPAGTCVIDANQAGNATYAPAPTAKQTVNVALIPQTIAFTNTPPTLPIVGDTYTVTATGGGSGNPVTFTVDGTSTAGCSVGLTSGVVLLPGPAGNCVIDANQAGNTSYAAAATQMQAVGVGVAPQTITYTSTPPAVALTGNNYPVTATGGASGNPVVISVDSSSTSGCTINPATDVVTFDSPTGTCVIDANQAGNASYAAAPQVQQNLNVYSQQICGQQMIQTQSSDGTVQSGQVSASFTFQDYQGEAAPTDVCKGYTTFDASADNTIPGLSGNQTVTFASQDLATAHMTATIKWAVQGFCTPDGSGGTTACPVTYVSFDDGLTFVPQTYCSSAQAAGIQWCTTSRSYSYSAQGTQVTETWDGYGDPIYHHG